MAWAHKLVLGTTGYGKSTILRRLIAKAWDQGIATLMLDPNLEDDWGEGVKFLTDDPGTFMDVAKRSTSCLVIVDEAGETLERNPKYKWIVTRSRQFGHIGILASHFATDILPVMRNQCTEAFVFLQDPDSAKVLARRYVDELFLRASTLQVGQYIHKRGTETARIEMLNLGGLTIRKARKTPSDSDNVEAKVKTNI